MTIALIVLAIILLWAMPRRPRSPRLPGVVRVTPEQVTFESANGEARTIPIGALIAVDVVTTDQGPFADDVFWVLTPRDGEPLVIPSESQGCSELLERLGELEGFDHRSVIFAMGSTDNARFPCWRSGSSAPHG